MATNKRFYALDAFRGATVVLMILVNNPGTWSHIYAPLRHAAWHGLTPTDLVFPFFLFAVGNAMAFVMPRMLAQGSAIFWKKTIKRSLLLCLIGLLINWFPFLHWADGQLAFNSWEWTNDNGDISGVRIMGTLQRIGICYFFASAMVYFIDTKKLFYSSIGILLFYWLLCYIKNPTDPFSITGWFGTAVDKSIFGAAHLYPYEVFLFEPEGIISTLPTIVSVISGYIIGKYIYQCIKQLSATDNVPVVEKLMYKMLTILFIVAAFILCAGYMWGLVFPVNKKIWSSSFVLLTSGLAIALLAVLIYFIEVKRFGGKWLYFFNMYGKNALFIYALSELVPRGLHIVHISTPKGITTPLEWLYNRCFALVPGLPENGSLFYAIFMVLLYGLIAYLMDKKGIYIKI